MQVRPILVLVGLTAVLFGQTGPFGLSLSPGTQALLAQVEEAFHHPIIKIEGKNGPLLGSSYVTTEGFPAIELSPRGTNEATFAHELMHLLLRSEGYPIVVHTFRGGGEPTGALARDLNRNLLLIRDPIEHWIFEPKMKELGVNANLDSIARMQAFLKDGNFKGIAPELRTYMETVYYFQAALILDKDPDLLQQVRDRYLRNGWRGEADLGQKMAGVVLTSMPASARDEVDCYVACSNLILRKVHLAVSKWTEKPLGTFTEKIAVVELTVNER